MANFKQKFETLEASKSPKVKLDLGTMEKTDKDEWVGGLKKLYLHNKEGKKKAIGIFRCTKCNNEVASYEGEGHSRVCSCGGNLKLVDVIDREIVSEITSRGVGYQCPVCGKVYRYPVECCVPAKSLNVGEIRSF